MTQTDTLALGGNFHLKFISQHFAHDRSQSHAFRVHFLSLFSWYALSNHKQTGILLACFRMTLFRHSRYKKYILLTFCHYDSHNQCHLFSLRPLGEHKCVLDISLFTTISKTEGSEHPKLPCYMQLSRQNSVTKMRWKISAILFIMIH